MSKDLYIITKYLFASSALDAIKKEKETPVTNVILHEDYLREKLSIRLANRPLKEKEANVGFNNKIKNISK